MIKPDTIWSSTGIAFEITSPSLDVIQITMHPLLKDPYSAHTDFYLKLMSESIAGRIDKYRNTEDTP